MKVRRILVLVAAAALAQLGYAKAVGEHQAPRPRTLTPVRAKAPNLGQLGAEQAVLDFCSRVDSSDEKGFEAEGRTAFAGIRSDSIEKIRASAQYKDAYAQIGSVVGELPSSEAVQGCKSLLATGTPAKASAKNAGSNTGGQTGSTTGGHTGSPTNGHTVKSVGNRVKDSVRK